MLREVAARVHPPLVDRELIDKFMGTLQGQYYERLITSVSAGFSDMVIVGERVEEGLKNGKIQGGSSSQTGAKKSINNSHKKKEGKTNTFFQEGENTTNGASAQVPYFQYPYVATVQYPVISYQQLVLT